MVLISTNLHNGTKDTFLILTNLHNFKNPGIAYNLHNYSSIVVRKMSICTRTTFSDLRQNPIWKCTFQVALEDRFNLRQNR